MQKTARPPRPPPPPPPKPKSLSSNTVVTSSGIGSPGRKRGLGWPWDQPSSHLKLYEPHVAAGRISWLFNWECWIPDAVPAGVEWVPCVRTASNARDQLEPFLTDIVQNRGIKTGALLGFNEPEIPDQANLRVEEAVRLWRDVVLPVKRKLGLRLGSPGMSSDVGRSKPWLDAFLAQLQGDDDEIDFLVVHWYGPHFRDMRAFLEDMHATYRLPVWVNEFACSTMGHGEATAEAVEAFMREAIPWLDGCAWIERYAYFGNKDVGAWVGRGNNFTEDGGPVETDGKRLTRVGQLYCEL
ncbi:glycoside hydrolase [Cladophialophora carrionii]|uniref:Glycoside hydrolase n=1 Tax=Cladophialophora carrionii TaxID=86049 RepID=A0A1C1D1T7_9EURO|nr:glycoside hydrolase [Cladophialophora carrionii]